MILVESSRRIYTLALADGTAWRIVAGHAEAQPVVDALASAMMLRVDDVPGRPLVVVTQGHFPAVLLPSSAQPAVVCDVGAGIEVSPDLFPIQVSRLALGIARQTQPHGGVLLHGALAELPPDLGPGAVLLAGPGTVGKTTASMRLRPPWQSLCDDASLVLRDPQGGHWAHPWPTWSRFYGNGPGGSWDVQHAVPLRAIFFLRQSADDRTERISATEALALLAESVPQVSGPMVYRAGEAEARALRQEWLASAQQLAPRVPAFALYNSLSGPIAESMSAALRSLPASHPRQTPVPSLAARPTEDLRQGLPTDSDGTLTVVYTGPSMNPTLQQPDLLTVVPYGGEPVRAGDVLYFRRAAGEQMVVHRAMRVTAAGILTQGDNNPGPDDWLLAPEQVLGRVVAARDGRGVRPIAGGRQGLLAQQWMIWRKRVTRTAARWLHGAYHALSDTDILRRLCPPRYRPHTFAFRVRSKQKLRLMVGRREIGYWFELGERWHIQRPWRLLVGRMALPHPATEPDAPGWRHARAKAKAAAGQLASPGEQSAIGQEEG